MYLISQVSKITGLTKKALRYYDEQDILKPSFRDEGNQYRYYDEEDLSYILKEKIEHIENNISKEKALIKKMDHFLQPLPQVYEEKSYDITIEEINPVMVAGLRIQDSYNRIGKYVSELYKVVKIDKIKYETNKIKNNPKFVKNFLLNKSFNDTK